MRAKIPSTSHNEPAWWTAGLWLAGALFGQIFLAAFVNIRDARPSAFLVVTVWYAVRVNPWRAALFGFLGGLLEDGLAGVTGGAFAVSTAIAGALAAIGSRGFFADSIPIVTVIAFLASFARLIVFWIIMAIQGYPAGMGRIHLHEAVWQALMNAGFAALVILVARRYSPTNEP